MKIKVIVAVSVLISGCVALYAFSAGAAGTRRPAALSYNIDFSHKTAVGAKMLIGGNISHFNDSMRTWPVSALDIIKNLGITSVRTHDIKSLDWDMIFPDFQADPENPASYQFDKGDAILSKFTDAGLDIFLRLGVSHEASVKQRMPGVNPPDDVKWTSIIDHILKHYTAGWANGNRYNIHYVELWNEPDLKFWGGSQDDFIRLAKTSLPLLEKSFPQLKFGGFGLSNIAKNKDFADKLLSAMSDPNGDGNTNDRIRLDFFSWHVYEMQKGVQLFEQFSNLSRQLTRQYGYENAENICTEWNASLPSAYLQTNNAESDICSTLIWAANSGMRGLYFYPIVDSWGLINAPLWNMDFRRFQKTRLYNSFALFSDAYLTADGIVPITGEGKDDILVTTEQSKNVIRILIANRRLSESGASFNFSHLDLRQSRISFDLLNGGAPERKTNAGISQNGNSISIDPSDLNQSDVALITIQN